MRFGSVRSPIWMGSKSVAMCSVTLSAGAARGLKSDTESNRTMRIQQMFRR